MPRGLTCLVYGRDCRDAESVRAGSISPMRPTHLLCALLAMGLLAADTHAQAPGKTSFTADLGAISASGNTRLRTLSVGDKITHTNGKWVLSQLAAYVYGQTNSVASANQLRVAARSDYL